MEDEEQQVLLSTSLLHRHQKETQRGGWDWCGLCSNNENVRERAKLLWMGFLVVMAILLILIFAVILPSLVQSLVDSSELTLLSTDISFITNASFVSTSLVEFSKLQGPKVSLQLQTVTIEWNQQPGVAMIALSDANHFSVENHVTRSIHAQALVLNTPAFAAFNTYLMHTDSATWRLSGHGRVTVLNIATRVSLEKDLLLIGYNNFTVPPVITKANITNGSTTILSAMASVTITTVSTVQMNLNQSVFFRLEYLEEDLGVGYLPNYSLVPGTIYQTAYLDFQYSTASQEAALMDLLFHYTSGLDVNVTLKNLFTTTPIAWLAPALDSIEMVATLPACTTPLVTKIVIYESVNLFQLPFRLFLYNPQSVPVTITSLVGNVTFHDVLIASVDLVEIDPPIVIPPHHNQTSQQLVSQSLVNSASAQLLAAGSGLGSLFAQVGANFTAFPASFHYEQLNVTLEVQKRSSR